MRIALVFVLVALILALVPAPAAAADIRQGNPDITIGANETIEDDLYLFGNNISILGTVHGDVVAAGQNISVDGTISGDLLAAGSTVAIRGQVDGSVRAAGNAIVLDGRVGQDLVVGGTVLTINPNGRVGRDVLVGSSAAVFHGQVTRDVQAGTAVVTVDGRIGRDVLANAEKLTLTENAAIDGSLTYTSPNAATIANAAAVRGKTDHRVPTAGPQLVQGPAALVVEWLKGLVGLLLLGVIVVIFFPGFTRRAGEALVRSPWVSLLIGFVVLIGVPILSIVFFVVGAAIGGWWLGFVALAAYAVVIALAVPVAAVGLGGALLRITRRPAPLALALALGLVALLLIAVVPYFGGIVITLAILFGLGATTMAIVGGRGPEPAAA